MPIAVAKVCSLSGQCNKIRWIIAILDPLRRPGIVLDLLQIPDGTESAVAFTEIWVLDSIRIAFGSERFPISDWPK